MIIRPGSEVTRLRKAAGHSWNGYKAAWATEAAFRVDLLLLVVLGPVALWLGETGVERALLFGSLLLLVLAEVINTAIEVVVDRVGMERHPLSGKAKDLGSGAVLLALVHGAVVWGLVLLD
jgi:diacylglycerol kinase (ATP)